MEITIELPVVVGVASFFLLIRRYLQEHDVAGLPEFRKSDTRDLFWCFFNFSKVKKRTNSRSESEVVSNPRKLTPDLDMRSVSTYIRNKLVLQSILVEGGFVSLYGSLYEVELCDLGVVVAGALLVRVDRLVVRQLVGTRLVHTRDPVISKPVLHQQIAPSKIERFFKQESCLVG